MFSDTHHAVRAVGPRAGGVGVSAVVLHHRVECVVLSAAAAAAQQRLQGLDVADGVTQDLHLGESLVRVRRRAALQRLERVVDFAEPPPLPQRRRFAPVRVGGLPLAGLAGPQQAAARLVVPAGGADVLVVLVVVHVEERGWGGGGGGRGAWGGRGRGGGGGVVGFQQAHMHQSGVQVLEEVHVAGVEARIIIEIISSGDREGDIRQLHVSVPNAAQNTGKVFKKSTREMFPKSTWKFQGKEQKHQSVTGEGM